MTQAPRHAAPARPARSTAPAEPLPKRALTASGGATRVEREPRRGIAPARRRRHHLPLATAALAAAVIVTGVVTATMQSVPTSSGPGLLATPLQVQPSTEAVVSPAGVSTSYAAGAFAAPETGGVRLVSHVSGPLSGKVIVVDPGHNGAFSAAINNRDWYTFGAGWRPCVQMGTTTFTGVPEHTIVWQLANRLVPVLLAKGATVVLTRADDTGYGPCNNERPEIANRNGANLYLSLHVDGNPNATLRGFSLTWSTRMAGGDNVSAASRRAAEIVTQHVLSQTTLPASNYMQTNGVPIIQRPDLSVLDGIRGAPAVLMETGNSRNHDDVAFLTSNAGQTSLVQALAAAVQEIVTSVPANTAAGASSPSPPAPAGASLPPASAAAPTWAAADETAANSPGTPSPTATDTTPDTQPLPSGSPSAP